MKQVVGVEIGSTSVRAASLNFDKHPPMLEAFRQEALPVGSVRGGEIMDPAAVAKAVTAVLGKLGSSVKSVMLTLANERVVARHVELPAMSEEELRGAIQFQVQEFIPIPIEQAVLDFQVLEEFTSEQGEAMMRLLVVAAHKDMVLSYVDVLRRAGVDPVGIDFTPLSIIRALAGSDRLSGSDGAEALVQAGTSVSSFVVQEAGIPKFARVLASGGTTETGEDVGDEERVEAFVDQVRDSIEYYLGQAGSAPITKVVLCGNAKGLEEMQSRLSANLKVPVEIGRPLERLQMARKALGGTDPHEAESVMAGPVGVAMGVAA